MQVKAALLADNLGCGILNIACKQGLQQGRPGIKTTWK